MGESVDRGVEERSIDPDMAWSDDDIPQDDANVEHAPAQTGVDGATWSTLQVDTNRMTGIELDTETGHVGA